MTDKVLDFLRKNSAYISGEEISRHLKISRAAIWKHIQELRQSGYEIEAVPHLGYKLISAPDKLLPSEIGWQLGTKFIGKKIYYFDTVTSTMEAATDLGLKNAPEGTVIISEGQTRGKGRLGRSWSSPKHKGIYFSLILRPKISPLDATKLTLLAAVAVCEAIREYCGLDAAIKWPNDILFDNAKVGGILTELNAETDMVRFIVIGIGINVNNDKSSLVENATSLKEEKGTYVNRVEFLRAIFNKFEDNYVLFQKEGPSRIIEKWRQFSSTLGSRVKVVCQKEHVEGEALDIDLDGGLLVRKDSGFIEKVMAGDVVKIR